MLGGPRRAALAGGSVVLSPAGTVSVATTFWSVVGPRLVKMSVYSMTSPAFTTRSAGTRSSASATTFCTYSGLAGGLVGPTTMSVGWSPLASMPSTSVGSGTVELESTLPWLLITVPSGTPAFTVTRNVIVTVSPTRSGPTATASVGAPDSSVVPRVVVSVPGTNVAVAGTVSVNTTSSTSRSRPLRTTVYSMVSPGRRRPPLRSTTVFWASTKAAAVARTHTLVSVV